MASKKIKVSLNKNSNEKDLYKPDGDKISLLFVDSLFKDIQDSGQEIKDPLNVKNNSKDLSLGGIKQLNSDLKTPQKNNHNTQDTSKTSNTKSSKKPNFKHNSVEKNPQYFNRNRNYLNINSSTNTLKIPNTYRNRGIERNDSNKGLKKPNHTISEKFLAKMESEREKKLYEKKVKLMENRILGLKRKEDEMNRRKLCNEKREKYLNKAKKVKNDFKQKLMNYNIDQKNALEERRKALKEQNSQFNNELKETLDKAKFSKIKNYQKLMKEKKYGKNLINKNNKNFLNYGKTNAYKIKKEREDFKKNEIKKMRKHGRSMDNFYIESCEDNKQETNRLKDKLAELEKLETEYIRNIYETRKGLVRNNSTGIYFFKRDINPIEKLILDDQIEENLHLNKKKNKKCMVKKLSHRSYDGKDFDINFVKHRNESLSRDIVIKGEKKIKLNNKK